MYFSSKLLRGTFLVFLAAVTLAGCESFDKSNDSLNRIREKIDAYLQQSEPLPDRAFISNGALTVVVDRISHLDSNFDQTDTRNYYVSPCTSTSGAYTSGQCLYSTDLNGQRIPGTGPLHEIDFLNSDLYGPYFRFDQCKIVTGLTKTCAPDDGEVILTANGAGYSGNIHSTALVTWYQDRAEAERARSIREMMLPNLLNGRITKADVRGRNDQIFSNLTAIIEGINSGLSNERSSGPGIPQSSYCPVRENMSREAYNDMLIELKNSTGVDKLACLLSTAQDGVGRAGSIQ